MLNHRWVLPGELDEKLEVFQKLSIQKAWEIIMAIKSSEGSPET